MLCIFFVKFLVLDCACISCCFIFHPLMYSYICIFVLPALLSSGSSWQLRGKKPNTAEFLEPVQPQQNKTHFVENRRPWGGFRMIFFSLSSLLFHCQTPPECQVTLCSRSSETLRGTWQPSLQQTQQKPHPLVHRVFRQPSD